MSERTQFVPTFPLLMVLLGGTASHARIHCIELASGHVGVPLFTDPHLLELHIQQNKIKPVSIAPIATANDLLKALRAFDKAGFENVIFDPGRVGETVPFVGNVKEMIRKEEGRQTGFGET